jgi:hypothetical protein
MTVANHMTVVSYRSVFRAVQMLDLAAAWVSQGDHQSAKDGGHVRLVGLHQRGLCKPPVDAVYVVLLLGSAWKDGLCMGQSSYAALLWGFARAQEPGCRTPGSCWQLPNIERCSMTCLVCAGQCTVLCSVGSPNQPCFCLLKNSGLPGNTRAATCFPNLPCQRCVLP